MEEIPQERYAYFRSLTMTSLTQAVLWEMMDTGAQQTWTQTGFISVIEEIGELATLIAIQPHLGYKAVIALPCVVVINITLKLFSNLIIIKDLIFSLFVKFVKTKPHGVNSPGQTAAQIM